MPTLMRECAVPRFWVCFVSAVCSGTELQEKAQTIGSDKTNSTAQSAATNSIQSVPRTYFLLLVIIVPLAANVVLGIAKFRLAPELTIQHLQFRKRFNPHLPF